VKWVNNFPDQFSSTLRALVNSVQNTGHSPGLHVLFVLVRGYSRIPGQGVEWVTLPIVLRGTEQSCCTAHCHCDRYEKLAVSCYKAWEAVLSNYNILCYTGDVSSRLFNTRFIASVKNKKTKTKKKACNSLTRKATDCATEQAADTWRDW